MHGNDYSRYRIAGNFHLKKILTSFAQAHRGQKFFHPVKILSHKLLHAHVFTRGYQAVLVVVVAHDHKSAVLPGIKTSSFSICS